MKPWDDAWMNDVLLCISVLSPESTSVAFGYVERRKQNVCIHNGWKGGPSECEYDFDNYPPFYVRIDGTPALLSRDEDECLLFATLWELER